MSLRWDDTTVHRSVALSGSLEVGAVFPPLAGNRWRWLMFVGGPAASVSTEGGAVKSEADARECVRQAWQRFLHMAELVEK